MIDRGALVLATPAPGSYRGLHRPPLDAWTWPSRRGRTLRDRYRESIVAGDGVLEDLDEALEIRAEALRLGHPGVDVVVFEAPQGAWIEGALPVAAPPPSEGLLLLGWDVVELLEPFWSPIADVRGADAPALNASGLFASRADAERYLRTRADAPDEPLHAVRAFVAVDA